MTDPVVATRYGSVRGSEDDGVLCFLGIPYARPPIGSLRFRASVPAESWSGVRQATEVGPIAPQPESLIGGYVPGDPRTQDEACLSLNVFTPGTEGRRPVLVFIHGGAFLIGTGGGVMYRGDVLARRGVVVVTFNYRLGALGFLAHPDLAHPASGSFANWGLLDQVAALEFVHDHATLFGGDPQNVTLFGESAGAMSAADLLAVPRARGLFRRAVLQSGATSVMTVGGAARNAERFVDALGLGAVDREALAKVPAQDLVDAQRSLLGDLGVGASMPFQPVVDGDLLPRHPDEVVASGAVNADSLLIGTNRDEFRFFTIGQRHLDEIGDIELAGLVQAYLPDPSPIDVFEVIGRYRMSGGGEVTPRRLFEQIAADGVFWAPSIRLATAVSSRVPTYCYRFDWESPFMSGALGACHGLELPFVFGTADNPLIGLFSGGGPEAVALVDTVQAAWVAFATSGDPSTAEHPWPAYDTEERSTFVMGRSVALVPAPRERERLLWDELLGLYGEPGGL